MRAGNDHRILQPKYGAYYFTEWDWDLTNESFLTHFIMV